MDKNSGYMNELFNGVISIFKVEVSVDVLIPGVSLLTDRCGGGGTPVFCRLPRRRSPLFACIPSRTDLEGHAHAQPRDILIDSNYISPTIEFDQCFLLIYY